MKRTATIAAMWAAATLAAPAAPYVVLKSGQQVPGVSIRAKADGSVVLTRADGQQLVLTRDQYTQAVADRPPEFDAGLKAVQGQKFDEAIPLLKKVVDEYKYLAWDERALVVLGRAYAGKKDHASAIAAYEELFRGNPAAEKEAAVMWGYLEALLGAGQAARLEPRLDQMIREGARPDAARAQMMRGDVKAAAGQLEAAALDYLRTVLFFKKEADVQPEAHLRVAETLEKMRDNRAKEWYRRLAEDFPGSPQAAAAKGKY
jgi:tetratricopeptide (TPR) repeat protein